MIRKILIEGVRTHERTEIELGRLTCLVGPNGSGKSTVLNAFCIFRLGEPPHWRRSGSKSDKVEVVTASGKQVFVVAGKKIKKVEPPVTDLIVDIPFRPDSRVLRQPSSFAEAQPQLSTAGRQLAAVLAAWKLSDELKFQSVIQKLRQVVPTLEDVRPSTTTIEFDQPAFELLFDFLGAPSVPAVVVSEGTLLALALLTVLHSVDRQKIATKGQSTVVLLDDIDRGLHPDAQLEVVRLLRELAEQKDLQIVMTTHSPYVVDALAPEEVCVLALDGTGTTRARKLSEIPGADRYRGMLSTGELWSTHGESWVLEEQAKQKSA